jgi:uncharacterized membrane protein YphA (DoxX/SURF4 family)
MSESLISNSSTRRWPSILLWILRALLALLFAAAGAFKLAGAPPMVDEFARVGLGQWFRYFTGVCELSGAALLLWPRTVAFGAALLACVSIGAFFAQLLVLHQDVIHAIVFAAILGGIAWVKRDQLAGLLKGATS